MTLKEAIERNRKREADKKREYAEALAFIRETNHFRHGPFIFATKEDVLGFYRESKKED